MSALASIRCGCDPHEIAGLRPGRPCPDCRLPCDPWSSHTAMVFVADARDDLRIARLLAEKALIADDDGDTSRRRLDLAAASEIATRAANALAFAFASLNEEGRPTTGMAGARDQDPRRSQ